MEEHIKIINNVLADRQYSNILDLGSGRTSMGILFVKG